VGATDIYYNDEGRIFPPLAQCRWSTITARQTYAGGKENYPHAFQGTRRSHGGVDQGAKVEKIQRNSLDVMPRVIRCDSCPWSDHRAALWINLPEAREWWRVRLRVLPRSISPGNAGVPCDVAHARQALHSAASRSAADRKTRRRNRHPRALRQVIP